MINKLPPLFAEISYSFFCKFLISVSTSLHNSTKNISKFAVSQSIRYSKVLYQVLFSKVATVDSKKSNFSRSLNVLIVKYKAFNLLLVSYRVEKR